MKFLKNFSVALFAMATVFGCNKVDIENTPSQKAFTINATVAVPVDNQETKATTKIKLDGTKYTTTNTWSIGDVFSVYDSEGNFVANFTATETKGTFEGTILSSGDYTAIYPANGAATLSEYRSANSPLLIQVDDANYDHIGNNCSLEAPFTVADGDNSIDLTFNHKKTLLLVEYKLPTQGTSYPNLVAAEVKIGSTTYQVACQNHSSNTTTKASALVAFLVDPIVAGTECTVTLYSSLGGAYKYPTQKFKSNFDAGATALAKVGDMTEHMIENGYMILGDESSEMSIKNATSKNKLWIVGGISNGDDLTELKNKLNENGMEDIYLILHSGNFLPKGAFKDVKSLSAFYGTTITGLAANLFDGCVNLKQIIAPRTSTISENALKGCSGLTNLDLTSNSAYKLTIKESAFEDVDASNIDLKVNKVQTTNGFVNGQTLLATDSYESIYNSSNKEIGRNYIGEYSIVFKSITQ